MDECFHHRKDIFILKDSFKNSKKCGIKIKGCGWAHFSGSIRCRDSRGQNYPTFHGVASAEIRIRMRFKNCNSRDYYSHWFLLYLDPFSGVCRWNPVLDCWNKVILLFVALKTEPIVRVKAFVTSSIKCYERKDSLSPVSGMTGVPDDNEESDKNLLSVGSDVTTPIIYQLLFLMKPHLIQQRKDCDVLNLPPVI